MKIRLLIASAIVGMSFYATADVGIAEGTNTNASYSENINEKTLFGELSLIKIVYEDEIKKLQQEGQDKSTALNSSSVNVEKKQLDLAQKERELASLERSIIENKKSLMTSLDENSDKSTSLFNTVQQQLARQKSLISSIATLKEEEQNLRAKVEGNLDALSATNRKQDALILKTKEDIRLVVANELNSPIFIKTQNTVQCSLDESLKTCMGRPSIKEDIIASALHSQLASNSDSTLFQDLDYKILNFEYLGASQNLDGTTRFSVEASVLINSNSHMFTKLYQFVGLPETGVYKLTLLSNRDASFSINGRFVGKGKEVVVNVERGEYVISAKYEGRSESTQENLGESQSLFYRF